MSSKQTEDFEKDIVSFDQAVKLCVIGFDKQTLCGYDIADRQLYLCQVDEDGIYMPQKDLAAPTKSQVFRWFREKYSLLGAVQYFTHGFFCYTINEMKDTESKLFTEYPTYEEAEDACVNELIELAKQ